MVLPCSLVVVKYTVFSKVELKTLCVNAKNKNGRVRLLTRQLNRLAELRKQVEMVLVGSLRRDWAQPQWQSTSSPE